MAFAAFGSELLGHQGLSRRPAASSYIQTLFTMSTSNKNTETKQPNRTAEEQRMASERNRPGTPQSASYSPGKNRTPDEAREDERTREAKHRGEVPTGSRHTTGKEQGLPNDRSNKH